MNMAQQAARLAATSTAITFTGGYAVNGGGQIARFPVASVIKERRNEAHRVTYGLYIFPDSSKLEMKRVENRFTRFTVKA